MKTRISWTLQAVLACFLLVSTVAGAQGSYLDTIYQADDSQAEADVLAPAPQEDESSTESSDSYGDDQSLDAQASEPAAPSAVQLGRTAHQVLANMVTESGFGDLVRQAMSQKTGQETHGMVFARRCGFFGRLWQWVQSWFRNRTPIWRPPTQRPPTQRPPVQNPPTQRPPVQNPPTQQPPSNNPGQSSGNTSIAGLKAEMLSKFGVSAQDGYRAAWSQRQLEEANKVLASLPPDFRKHTRNIVRDASCSMGSGVLGYVRMGIPTVHMLNLSCRQGTFQQTLVHEMTHTFQANNSAITRAYQNTFWPGGRMDREGATSRYGATQPIEDMAEAVKSYWANGSRMKASHPRRYEFVRRYVMGGREY